MDIHISLQGLLLGLVTFFVIGLFHPIVVKAEYYYGTRLWWLFLLAGAGGAIAALFIQSLFWSAVASIVGFSSLWSIKELFEQKERVRKGWFPKNPKRKH